MITGKLQFLAGPDSLDNVLTPTSPPSNIPTSHMLEFSSFIQDEDTLQILLEVRHYLLLFEPGTETSVNSRFGIPKECEIHIKNSWLFQQLLTETPSGTEIEPMAKCCRYGAAIFMFFPFDNHYPDPTLVLNSLLHKLIHELDAVLPCAKENHVIVLWLLCVAGVAASELPAERDWILGYLVDSAIELEIKSWEDLRTVLRRVLWTNTLDDRGFRALWDHVLIVGETLL